MLPSLFAEYIQFVNLYRGNLVNIKMNYVLNFDASDYVMVGFRRTDEVIMHMDSSGPVT